MLDYNSLTMSSLSHSVYVSDVTGKYIKMKQNYH